MSGIEQFSAFGGKQLSRLVANFVGPLNRVPREVFVPPAAEPKFVKDRRRESGDQRCREKPRISLHRAIPAAWPIRDTGLRRGRPIMFLRKSDRRFVI